MRLTYPLLIALACSVACASDEKTQTDDSAVGTDEDDGDDNIGAVDAGTKKDGSSKPPPGMSVKPGDADDEDDAKDDEDDDACDSFSLVARPQSPDILVVLDRSGSMVGFPIGVNRWNPSVSALNKLTANLTQTVKFGLLLFPAAGGGALEGLIAGCQPGKLSVPLGLNTAPMIASTLAMSTPDVGQTPTASALTAALQVLEKPACPDCPNSSKYVLLVTDGAPTCSNDPVNETNAALDALTAAKVKTYVIGYDTSDAVTSGIMNGFAQHGGTDKYLAVEDEASLVAELTRIAGSLVPCEYELEMEIADPSFVSVKIDDVLYQQGKDWRVEGRKIILDPSAPACSTLRDAKIHSLKIRKECKPLKPF